MICDGSAEKPRGYTGMAATTLPGAPSPLASFLRDRRARLRPEANAGGRRRTPGLRREEVAARAGVSVTWYTWLEQGRGGAPSAEVLERLARALELDSAGREMLFLLGQQRPPPLRPDPPKHGPTALPAPLRAVLDALTTCPAIVKTPTCDLVGWNEAAEAVLGHGPDAGERNMLRNLFCNPAVRARLPDWETNARFMIAVFRYDIARLGGSPEADALVAELCSASADFRRLWAENDVKSHGFGTKRIAHPVAGPLTLQFATFAVAGADHLTMITFAPATAADARAVEVLIARKDRAA